MKDNVLIMLAIIGPQIFGAAINKELALFHALTLLLLSFIPCHDKKFGKGRPYFWIRQTCFIVAALIAVIISVL